MQPTGNVSDPFSWAWDKASHAVDEVLRFPGDTINTAYNAAESGVDLGFHIVNLGFDELGGVITGTVGTALGIVGTVLGGTQPPPATAGNVYVPAKQTDMTPILIGAAALGGFFLYRKYSK